MAKVAGLILDLKLCLFLSPDQHYREAHGVCKEAMAKVAMSIGCRASGSDSLPWDPIWDSGKGSSLPLFISGPKVSVFVCYSVQNVGFSLDAS